MSIISAGTSNTTSLVYTGDTTGAMVFQTNGTNERMRITSDGKIGIGIANPGNDVIHVNYAEARMKLNSSTGTNGAWTQYTNNAGSFYVGRDNSVGTAFGTAYASYLYSEGAYPLVSWVNGSERMRITSGGDVGIGTTNPSQKLEVAGYGAFTGANRGVILGENNCLIVGTSATLNSSNMDFYTANTLRMRVDTSGRVTMPYQPAFSAYIVGGNVLGSAPAGTVIVWNAVDVNISNSYSDSTGRFTAPVAGRYYFCAMGMLSTATSSDNADIQLRIRKNGNNYSICNPPVESNNQQGMSFSASAVINLAVNDYVDVTFYSNLGTASQFYGGGGPYSNFSGFLIG